MCARSVIATKPLTDFICERQRLDQRREGEIEEQVSVLGVVDDVGDLLRKQPRIDRVQHRPRAGDAVVELQVAVAVPRERGDAIAGLAPTASPARWPPASIGDGCRRTCSGGSGPRPCARRSRRPGASHSACSISEEMRSGRSCISPCIAPLRAAARQLAWLGSASGPVSSIRSRPSTPASSAGEKPYA